MATPAPATARNVVQEAINARVANRQSRSVNIVMFTTSINDQGSDDGKWSSWHGDLQDRYDARYPTTGARPRGFETFAADFAFSPPDPEFMEPDGDKGSGALLYGFGKQATYQSAGDTRGRSDPDTTGYSFLVQNVKPTDTYELWVTGEATPRFTFAGGPVAARRHLVSGLDRTKAPRVFIKFTNGTNLIYGGMFRHDGTETKSVRVVNFGRAGVSALHYSLDAAANWANFLPVIADDMVSGPDIVMISMGTNDQGKADFGKNIRFMIEAIRKRCPNAIILLMLEQEPSTAPAGDWAGKLAAHHEIAAEYPMVAVTPLSTVGLADGIPKLVLSAHRDKMLDVLHPRTKLYKGTDLPYGYGPTSFKHLTGVYVAGGTVPDPGDGGTTPTPTPGAEPVPATPTGFGGFAFTGTSLLEQMSPWSAKLRAAFAGFSFVNRAKGGFLSDQAAAFQGGEPAMVTFPNGIPAGTGSTPITVSPNLLAMPGANSTWQTDGYVKGVNGTITAVKTTVNGVVKYVHTFARTTAGAAVETTGPVPFLTGFAFRNRVMIAEITRNSSFITTPTIEVNRWRNMKAWALPELADAHILLQTPPADKPTEMPGTANRAKIDANNAALAAAHPANYLAVVDFLCSVEALRSVGITPTAADLVDIENGFIPESFRIDGDTLHYNQVAYDAMTPMIVKRLTERGILPTEDGGQAPDTTAPSITVLEPANNFVVPVDGTVDFVVRAVDGESGLSGSRGFFALPDFKAIGNRTAEALPERGADVYGVLGVPWSEIRALMGDAASFRWYASFRDKAAPSNVGDSAPRVISAAATTAPIDNTVPAFAGVTPTDGTSIPATQATVSFTATITHAAGIATASVYAYGSGQPLHLGKATKDSTTNVWRLNGIDAGKLKGSSRFAFVAASTTGKTASSEEVAFTFAAGLDTLAPVGSVTSPLAGTVLPELAIFTVQAQDGDSGLDSVELYAGDVKVGDMRLTSGTVASGVWTYSLPVADLAAFAPELVSVRARLTDKAGNPTYTPSVAVALPSFDDFAGAEVALLDTTIMDWIDPDIRQALATRYGGEGGIVLLRDPATGKLYDPSR
jgi:lysophospholipase L1-like esterase